MTPSVSVMVDNSIRSIGEFARPIRVPIPGHFNQLALMEIRPARSPNERWRQAQFECLPTVVKLAQENRLKLHTYQELYVEKFRIARDPSFLFGDLFADVEIEWLPAAVRRGLFRPGFLEDFVRPGTLREFCKWLIRQLKDHQYTKDIREKISQFEIDNIENIDVFKKLCNKIDEKHYEDAFHLWTCSVNRVDVFLTADRAFANVVKQAKVHEMACRVQSPDEMLSEMGVSEREPFPFEFGKWYYLSGLPYD